MSSWVKRFGGRTCGFLEKSRTKPLAREEVKQRLQATLGEKSKSGY